MPKDYLTHNLDRPLPLHARHHLERATGRERAGSSTRRRGAAPDNDVLFYNLGLIYCGNGLFEESRAAFRRSAEINPREIASASKPRASDRVTELEAEIAERDALVARLSSDPSVSSLGFGTPDRSAALARLLAASGRPIWARGVRLRTSDDPNP